MRVTIERRRLLDAVSSVQEAAPTTALMSAMECIRIEATETGLTLQACDLETYARVEIGDVEPTESGALLVPAKPFVAVVRRSSGEYVTLREQAEHLQVASGRYVAKLPLREVDDFPEWPGWPDGEDAWGTVTSDSLIGLLKRTLFAVSRESIRYDLSGVRIEVDDGGGILAVATDGHRMAIINNAEMSVVLPSRGIMIPGEGCHLIAKTMSDHESISIAVTPKHIFLDSGDGHCIIMRLIAAEYPDWRAIIPEEEQLVTTAWVHRESLISAMRRVSVMVASGGGIVLKFAREMLTLSTTGHDGAASEELDCLIEGAGVTAQFNPGYWLDALRVMESERAKVRFVADAEGPCLITGEDDPGWRYLVMPRRM